MLAGLMNPVTAALPLYAYASARGGVFYEVVPNQLGVGLGIAAATNNGWSGAPALGGGLAFDAMGRIMIAGVGLDASMGFAPLIAL